MNSCIDCIDDMTSILIVYLKSVKQNEVKKKSYVSCSSRTNKNNEKKKTS